LPALLLRKSQGSPGENYYEKIYLFMGFNNRTQVLHGQVWRLFTNIFLHFSVTHLVSNMIVLVYIGSLIECKLGKWNFLLMYLFCGITASMASVMWSGVEISAGASGAIFGLFGILLALLSTDFYERSARKALLISTAIFVGYNIIPVGAGIDHAAHFGGLVSGYIFGLMAYAGLNHRNIFIKKWGIALTGAAMVVIFVACGMLYTPQYQTKEFEKLVQRTETVNEQINADFYHNNDSVTRPQKLALIEHDALPRLAGLKKIGAEFKTLTLPHRLKNEAAFRASLINLECRFYQLLYLEFKEENKIKYRPEIADVTNQINKVRSEWGEDTGN
jgi:rhomboid protease GluP